MHVSGVEYWFLVLSTLQSSTSRGTLNPRMLRRESNVIYHDCHVSIVYIKYTLMGVLYDCGQYPYVTRVSVVTVWCVYLRRDSSGTLEH